MIEVIELGNEAIPGANPVNIVLSIEVDDADAWHDELVRRGTPITRGLEDAPWMHRSFGIGDPDGFRIWYYHDMNKKKLNWFSRYDWLCIVPVLHLWLNHSIPNMP